MDAPPLKTPRTCSQCGNNGHNCRTCSGAGAGFMLFGVRLTATESSPADSPVASPSSSAFRKSVSMNNLCQYEQQQRQDSAGNVTGDGYASDDALHASGSRRSERKRGIPWTEEEHRRFLMGLNKVGKGDWRGISRNFVKTRTPTQVASHAQKYFLRRTNINRRRRRSSLFDITTDAVTNSPIEEEPLNQDLDSPSQPLPPLVSSSPNIQNSTISIPSLFPKPLNPQQTCPVPLIPIPPSAKMANLNLNHSPPSSSPSTSTNTSRSEMVVELDPFLSLKPSSTPAPTPSGEGSVSRASGFGEFNNSGDSMISVA